jgi:carbamoyltransferase
MRAVQVLIGISAQLSMLVEAYGQRTGIPLLLNTSFNLAGEAIVNRADQNSLNGHEGDTFQA